MGTLAQGNVAHMHLTRLVDPSTVSPAEGRHVLVLFADPLLEHLQLDVTGSFRQRLKRDVSRRYDNRHREPMRYALDEPRPVPAGRSALEVISKRSSMPCRRNASRASSCFNWDTVLGHLGLAVPNANHAIDARRVRHHVLYLSMPSRRWNSAVLFVERRQVRPPPPSVTRKGVRVTDQREGHLDREAMRAIPAHMTRAYPAKQKPFCRVIACTLAPRRATAGRRPCPSPTNNPAGPSPQHFPVERQ